MVRKDQGRLCMPPSPRAPPVTRLHAPVNPPKTDLREKILRKNGAVGAIFSQNFQIRGPSLHAPPRPPITDPSLFWHFCKFTGGMSIFAYFKTARTRRFGAHAPARARGRGCVGAFGAHARVAFCLGRDRSSLVGGTMTSMQSPTPDEPYICAIAPQFR